MISAIMNGGFDWHNMIPAAMHLLGMIALVIGVYFRLKFMIFYHGKMIDDVRGSQEKIAEVLDRLAEKLASYDTRLAVVENTVLNIDRRLENVENEVHDLNTGRA